MKKAFASFYKKYLMGFTLMEIVIVVLIVGVLAALALPQYGMFMERARAAEGIGFLNAIRGAQLRYFAEHGSYVSLCWFYNSSGPQTCAEMDITIPRSLYFSSVLAHQYDPPYEHLIGVVARGDRNRNQALFSQYVLYIGEDGTFCCNNNGVAGSCNRLNITNICTPP